MARAPALVRLVAALIAFGVVISGCSSGADQAPPSAPSVTPARTLDPAAVTSAVEDYIDQSSVGLRNIRAVLVSVDGVTQVAHYRVDFWPTDRAHIFSVTKSVLSTLVGIAIEEGVLEGLDQELRTLLPEYAAEMSETVASITVEQLVTMTSGLPEGTLEYDPRLDRPDWIREVLRDGTAKAPGSTFIYSDPGSDVLAAVLTAALARHDGDNPRSLLDFARETLFDPLEIESRPAYEGFEGNDPVSAGFHDRGFGWATDRRGRHYGCCMLKLTATDMVKLGELYLRGGTWDGRQLISAEWVAAATTPIPQTPEYGRMWWITELGGRPTYYADGRGGQLIVVVPDLELVVAVLSTFDLENDTNKYMRGNDLLPMVNDVVLSRLG